MRLLFLGRLYGFLSSSAMHSMRAETVLNDVINVRTLPHNGRSRPAILVPTVSWEAKRRTEWRRYLRERLSLGWRYWVKVHAPMAMAAWRPSSLAERK